MQISATLIQRAYEVTGCLSTLVALGETYRAKGFNLEISDPSVLHEWKVSTCTDSIHAVKRALETGKPVELRRIAPVASLLLQHPAVTNESDRATLLALVLTRVAVHVRRLYKITPTLAEAALAEVQGAKSWWSTKLLLAAIAQGVSIEAAVYGLKLEKRGNQILVNDELLRPLSTGAKSYECIKNSLEPGKPLHLRTAQHAGNVLEAIFSTMPGLYDMGAEPIPGATLITLPTKVKLYFR